MTEYLDEEEPVRAYDIREPYSSIETYPLPTTKGTYNWQTSAPVLGTTLLAFAGIPYPPHFAIRQVEAFRDMVEQSKYLSLSPLRVPRSIELLTTSSGIPDPEMQAPGMHVHNAMECKSGGHVFKEGYTY